MFPQTVLVAVDLADGTFTAARPEGTFQPSPLPRNQSEADAQGRLVALQYPMTGVLPKLVIVARPGVGSWGGRIADGGSQDRVCDEGGPPSS